MEALTIFKNAGLTDYLNPDAIKGYMSNLSPYAKAGLTGAGVGAAGMGLASMFGGEEDESGGDKITRILGNMLKGTALGGAAGVGGQALYDNFLKPDAGLPPNIADLKNQLKTRTGKELDTQPFGVHHPFEQAAVTATHQSPLVDAGVGGAVGMGVNYAKGRGADKLFQKLTEKGLDMSGVKPPAGTTAKVPSQADGLVKALKGQVIDSPALKQRLMERFVSSMNGKANKGSVTRMADALNFGKDKKFHGAPAFNAQMDEFVRGGKLGAGQYKVGPANGGVRIPYTNQRYFENNSKVNAVKEWLANKAGPVAGGFAGNNIARYGKAGLAGAAAGVGAGMAGRGIVDSALALEHSPEQIAAWSQM